MGQRVTTLTAAQMLERWKLAGLYEPLHTDCEIECSEGIDLDALLMLRINAWYARIMATAPLADLPLTELAPQLTLSLAPDGAGRVMLPAGTLRVASVMMEGWRQPATVTADTSSPLALAQSGRFSRAGTAAPVAVQHPDSSLMLYTPVSPSARLLSVTAVIMPPEGTYVLTDSMKIK